MSLGGLWEAAAAWAAAAANTTLAGQEEEPAVEGPAVAASEPDAVARRQLAFTTPA
ncbi:ORFL200C [Human betaherpesvirus 5]|nr:ORFL200C [Human betaherpesvirus 5]QHX40551.1 ORFL200C [Human betaherpesvirus 5]